jgi:hypothetical protein
MELEATEFNLPDAIENTLTLVRERAHRHGIALGAWLTSVWERSAPTSGR